MRRIGRRDLPARALRCVAVMIAALLFVFYVTRLALPSLTLHDLTVPLDRRIPFSPPWITVYCLSFVFWIGSGLWICAGEVQLAHRFTASYVFAMLLSGAIFLLWPGTMARPEIPGSDFFSRWVGLIYRLDPPTNLCPSLHVLITYFCFRGAAQSGHIPRWYTVFSFIFFLLVCCCVLFVKQHALVDVPAAVAVGEAALQCGRLLRLERIPARITKKSCKE